jgi:RHS repeat-associated protein
VKYRIHGRVGSCTLTVAGDGTWLNYEEYTPFGETVFGGYAKKRYRFTGKERDEESGLYYHGQRYYAPWLARWTTTDPQGTVDGLNLYPYVGNNPVNAADPTGGQSSETNESGGGSENLAPKPSGDQATELKPVMGEGGASEAHYQFPAMQVSGSAPSSSSGGSAQESGGGGGNESSGGSTETSGDTDVSTDTGTKAGHALGQMVRGAGAPKMGPRAPFKGPTNLYSGGDYWENYAKNASGSSIADLHNYDQLKAKHELREMRYGSGYHKNPQLDVWGPASAELGFRTGLSGQGFETHGLGAVSQQRLNARNPLQLSTEIPAYAWGAGISGGLDAAGGGLSIYSSMQIENEMVSSIGVGAGIVETMGGTMRIGGGLVGSISTNRVTIARAARMTQLGSGLARFGGGVGLGVTSGYGLYQDYQSGNVRSGVGSAAGVLTGGAMLAGSTTGASVGGAFIAGWESAPYIEQAVENHPYASTVATMGAAPALVGAGKAMGWTAAQIYLAF